MGAECDFERSCFKAKRSSGVFVGAVSPEVQVCFYSCQGYPSCYWGSQHNWHGSNLYLCKNGHCILHLFFTSLSPVTQAVFGSDQHQFEAQMLHTMFFW